MAKSSRERGVREIGNRTATDVGWDPPGNMKEPVLTISKRIRKSNLQAAPIPAPDLGFLGTEKVGNPWESRWGGGTGTGLLVCEARL